MVASMTFPLDWPNDCPPAEAEAASGEVFRIVRESPASTADMLSHHETGRLPKAPACLRCGLSVFRTLEDAIHQQQLLPKLGKRIAMGTLVASHGKMQLTPGHQPTHATWWPCVFVDRVSPFSIVKEVT